MNKHHGKLFNTATIRDPGIGEMAQSIKCLLCQPEDLSLRLRTHKKRAWWHMLTIFLALGRQRQEDPGDCLATEPWVPVRDESHMNQGGLLKTCMVCLVSPVCAWL